MNQVTTANIIKMIRGLIKDLAQTREGDVFVYDSNPSFSLSGTYVLESSIKVYVNGTEISTFTFNDETNMVTISSSLTKNDVILIKYQSYEKYSDTEILAYINCSLSHFVANRYRKTFYINDEDEVVNLNGLNPSVEEANMIALITSIEIDPKNVDIKLPDFTISAQEDLSKTEQIKRMFADWQRSFGVIDFIDED
jgi:hypothetical protein